MKLFLKKILLFSLITVICLAVGEIVVRRLPTPYTYKSNYIKKYGAHISTLILGSSHTYFGIIPSELGDSVFNLANVSQTPEYDYALLKAYLPYMPNLRRVIIPISYFTFRDPCLEDLDRGLCVQYKIGMGLNLHSDFSIYNVAITDFKSYKGRLRSLLIKEESNHCDSLGFGLGYSLDHRNSTWKIDAARRAKDLTQFTPGRPEEVLKVLEAIAEYCKKHKIECIFITTPVSKEFREHTDITQYTEMANYAEMLKKRVEGRYYSFYSSSLFEEDDFHDSDHLSDIGARKLSRLLREIFSNGA